MSRLGRVMFLVERTRRTRPNDVAAVTDATADQVCELPRMRACWFVAIRAWHIQCCYAIITNIAC